MSEQRDVRFRFTLVAPGAGTSLICDDGQGRPPQLTRPMGMAIAVMMLEVLEDAACDCSCCEAISSAKRELADKLGGHERRPLAQRLC